MKDSFILYTKYGKQIQGLTMEQRGVLFTAILMHESGEPIPEMDACTQMAYSFICVDLDDNRQKYEEKCAKNAVNGAKGGRPPKSEEKQMVIEKTEKTERYSVKRTQPKKADNDSDNDNDMKKNNKKHTFGEYKKVSLTDEEYRKLVSEFGEQKTDQAITFLDAYIAEKGYKSKSHYLAIRRWVFDAIEQKKPVTRIPGRFQNFENRTEQSHKDMVAKLIAMQTGG